MRTRGFTLIELLVVLVVIGVVAGMATLSLGGREREAQLEREAQRLRGLIELAAQEAILGARTIGLRLERDGYSFQCRDGEGWSPCEDRGELRPRALPEGVELSWPEGADEGPGEGSAPQVLLLPGGELTPFDLLLSANEAGWRLTGFEEGGVELTPGERR